MGGCDGTSRPDQTTGISCGRLSYRKYKLQKLRKEMATTLTGVEVREKASEATRWGQLLFGIICMVMIANLQYGWTLFVKPIDDKYHWGRAAIQVAFTIFVLTETWLVPLEGYLVDRIGPRGVVVASGILVAAAWVVNSFAHTLPV